MEKKPGSFEIMVGKGGSERKDISRILSSAVMDGQLTSIGVEAK